MGRKKGFKQFDWKHIKRSLGDNAQAFGHTYEC